MARYQPDGTPTRSAIAKVGGSSPSEPSCPLPNIEVRNNLHYESQGITPLSPSEAIDRDPEGHAYVEMLCPGEAARLVSDENCQAPDCVRLRSYVASSKKTVIDRDTDLLTPEEYAQNKSEVAAAIKEELMVWIQHKCFARKPRKNARNILDVRWVGKWKMTKDKLDETKKNRIIRMRMTLRGFKDRDADSLETYAGTSSKVSQRLVVSEAVCQGWPLTAIDIAKAFLKGLSYEQLAEESNEPVRDVNFDLDVQAAAVLRTCPGFEDFDPSKETLHMTKPGTGCKDAPRAFALQLAQATNDKFGAKPTV